MIEPHTVAGIDSALQPFLYASDEGQASRHLEELVVSATPGIAKITKSSRAPEDAFQDAAYRIIRQLREVWMKREGNAIGNYQHYVKVVASRIVKGQIRDEHPRHRSLVDSLRHVLRRERTFALWDKDGEKLCGRAEWRDEQRGRVLSERLMRVLDEPGALSDACPSKRNPADTEPAELLAMLFDWIGHPIRFAELTKIVWSVKRLSDANPITDLEGRRGLSEWLADNRPRPDQEAEWKQFLRMLWEQIRQLPRLQRLAYLLNFTAADGQLEIFWLYGVATIRQIGAVLEISEQEYARAWRMLSANNGMRQRAAECASADQKFALLWQMLPLPDAFLATMLGTERQKVINLRKAAGDRLSRRMARPIALNAR